MIIVDKLMNWWRMRRCYVIADGNDNSVTLSRNLFNHIKRMADGDTVPKVFVFYIPATKCFGFAINPNIEQPTQLADIQYNDKYKCIGFESLNPTVQRILFEYGISNFAATYKLSVSYHEINGQSYYQIEKPHEKFTRIITPR